MTERLHCAVFPLKIKASRDSILHGNDTNLNVFSVEKRLSGFGITGHRVKNLVQNRTAVCHVSCVSHDTMCHPFSCARI